MAWSLGLGDGGHSGQSSPRKDNFGKEFYLPSPRQLKHNIVQNFPVIAHQGF